jgi:hypothetical protein
MNELARLLVIPPADIFNFKPSAFKCGFRLFNLDSKTAMGESEGAGVSEENLHKGRK